MCADTPHPGSELLGSWMRRYGRLVTYEFDLVADSGELRFGENGFERARFLLSEFQPAVRVSLVGIPPARIRILANGSAAEIAPGLLADVGTRRDAASVRAAGVIRTGLEASRL